MTLAVFEAMNKKKVFRPSEWDKIFSEMDSSGSGSVTKFDIEI